MLHWVLDSCITACNILSQFGLSPCTDTACAHLICDDVVTFVDCHVFMRPSFDSLINSSSKGTAESCSLSAASLWDRQLPPKSSAVPESSHTPPILAHPCRQQLWFGHSFSNLYLQATRLCPEVVRGWPGTAVYLVSPLAQGKSIVVKALMQYSRFAFTSSLHEHS